MWKRRGFNPHLSFAAFENDNIVAFTFNGVGNFNGQKIGFEVTRELNYFFQANDEIRNDIKKVETRCVIEKIDIEKYHFVSDFWDFYPSWQNSFEAISRASEDFISLGAFVDNKIVGYCVFEPNSGDVTQIAVDMPFRRQGIGSLLLYEAVKFNKIGKTKLLNADVSCNSIVEFLKAKNIEISGKQFEMIKKI